MSEGNASLDAHAYVDNSLSPAERDAFEAALRRDVKLRARVESWEAQNEAIRLAFGGAPRSRHAPPIGRPSNENNAVVKVTPARKGEPPRPLSGRAPLAPSVASAPKRFARWRAPALGGLVFLAAVVSFGGGPDDPRQALMRRADAALRSAAAFADTRLDFISDDPQAVAAWLGARFARIDPKRLAPPGWSLLGVRVVAGLDSAAALVLYEDAVGGRAALMLTPTDGLPDLPPTGERDADETILAGAAHGFAYAAVGPTRSGIGALIPVAFGD
jgi:anti-sigma factor RsiW